MGLRIFLLFRCAIRVRAVEAAVGRHAAEVHRSQRTAREYSAAEWLRAARYLENVATAFAVYSSVEIEKTIYCEEREEESVANPLFLLLWISALLWKVVSMATTPERMRSRYSNYSSACIRECTCVL